MRSTNLQQKARFPGYVGTRPTNPELRNARMNIVVSELVATVALLSLAAVVITALVFGRWFKFRATRESVDIETDS